MSASADTDFEAARFTSNELRLAARNHPMPLEALQYDVTPAGLHYLLIHFDIPFVDASQWRLTIGGEVSRSATFTLEELMARPATTVPVVLECAGNGRALTSPRNESVPWMYEGVGHAEWTGTPLKPLLQELGVLETACEVVFTGLDRGIQGGVVHNYQRSLPLSSALADDVLLAYKMNGHPLLPQHGYPVRLLVPGWYGMTSVKWLCNVQLVSTPFAGWQNAVAYRKSLSPAEPGEPVSRIMPRSLLVPPGVPDFTERKRHTVEGAHTLTGRAWSGWSPVVRVEVSTDGGKTWADASLTPAASPTSWSKWTYDWVAAPGEITLMCRATDGSGNVQPLTPVWNVGGFVNNVVQRHTVFVHRRTCRCFGTDHHTGDQIGSAGVSALSVTACAGCATGACYCLARSDEPSS